MELRVVEMSLLVLQLGRSSRDASRNVSSGGGWGGGRWRSWRDKERKRDLLHPSSVLPG